MKAKGSALVIALIAAAVLGSLAVALLMIVSGQSSVTFFSGANEDVLNIAEAGIGAALVEMNKNTDPDNNGIGNVSGQIAGGTYAVTISPPYADGVETYTLVSTATKGNKTAQIEVTVSKEPVSIFAWGAFGDKGVRLDSNAMVDSYDSALGPYSAQALNMYRGSRYARTNGDTGSNANVGLDSNAKVFGDAVAGPGGTVTTDGNSYISGTTSNLSEPVPLPPVVLPPAASLPPTMLLVRSNQTLTLPPGEYHFSKLDADSNSKLTIVGPATIVVDDFNIDSNAKLIVDSTIGPVKIYGTGRFHIDSNSQVRSTSNKPADIQLYIATVEDPLNPSTEVEVDSNSELSAVVYAPNARIDIDSNGHIYGSVVAGYVNIDSNAKVSYDEDLRNLWLTGSPYWKVKYWKRIR